MLAPILFFETRFAMSGQADVVVIGGGVIGTACAYYLAKTGKRVTLIDRQQFGAACSHGNCGYVCPSHVLPLAAPGAISSTLKTLFHKNSPLKVRPGFALANLGWFLNFARKCNQRDMLSAAVGIQALLNVSRNLYDDLLTTEAIDCEWDTHGLLFVFHTAAAFEHYSEVNHLLMNQFQMPAERYDRDAVSKLEPALKPDAASGGWLYKSDAQLRPDRLMSEWRKVLEKMGVTIHENCELKGFSTHAGGANAVQTNRGEIPATSFVVATGAWTPLLNTHLGCRIPIIPGKGYSLTMPRPNLCPTYPMIFEEHRVAISPFRTGYRIGSTMEFTGYDATINRDRLQLLRTGVSIYLQEPVCEPTQEEWCGWRPMVYDGKPIIDRSPTLPNVIIAAGHGMLGLSMATGTGKIVTAMLTQVKPPIELSHYSLARF